MQPINQALPPCRVYLHPTVTGDQSAIDAIVARTGLAVVVGTNRAALSLVERKPTGFTLDFPSLMQSRTKPLRGTVLIHSSNPDQLRSRPYQELFLDDLFRDLLHDLSTDPGNGGWIGDDPDPFNGGGKAA